MKKIEEVDTLKKSWKKKLATALLAAGVHAPTPNQAPSQKEEIVAAKKPDYNVPFGQHPMDHFLGAISTLESQGGKYTDHKPVNNSVHQGDSAMGTYALMPKTAQNIVGMLNSPHSKLRAILGPDHKDDEFVHAATGDSAVVAERFKANPALALRGARYLATHLHAMQHGDPVKASYAYRFGTNLPPTAITADKLKNSGYVKKFKELYSPEERSIASVD